MSRVICVKNSKFGCQNYNDSCQEHSIWQHWNFFKVKVYDFFFIKSFGWKKSYRTNPIILNTLSNEYFRKLNIWICKLLYFFTKHTRIQICTRCDQKLQLFLNFVSYICSISAFFSVILVYMSVIYVDDISHFGLSVYFWQIKSLVVFWYTLPFFIIRKKWIKGTVLSVV